MKKLFILTICLFTLSACSTPKEKTYTSNMTYHDMMQSESYTYNLTNEKLQATIDANTLNEEQVFTLLEKEDCKIILKAKASAGDIYKFYVDYIAYSSPTSFKTYSQGYFNQEENIAYPNEQLLIKVISPYEAYEETLWCGFSSTETSPDSQYVFTLTNDIINTLQTKEDLTFIITLDNLYFESGSR